jgi:succinylarginine dihydrolase
METLREFNFDGLVGPTHNYAGLSPGNLASTIHQDQVSNPREAALQGLAKMRLVQSLGGAQAILPPHPRPSLRVLRALGFTGSDERVLARAGSEDFHLVRLVSSAAAMWTANAATVAPSTDTQDGRLHLTPANLQAMFHRAIEADATTSVLRRVFLDGQRFTVHDPLPGGGHFADEGAANHTRLHTPERGAVHVFGWGRRAWGPFSGPTRHPARQTFEASQAIARLHRLDPGRTLFLQQNPAGIDAGAFHTDVLAVGTGGYLMAHERAFNGLAEALSHLGALLGEGFCHTVATEDELPVQDAVSAYPFNSQLIAREDGSMVLVAPEDSRENPRVRAFLERVVAGRNPVGSVRYLDVRESMHNGGGPACLRLRVPMTEEEAQALGARVVLTESLAAELDTWVRARYRDRLTPRDLADPELARESMAALDELTRILRLGSVYDFQQSA